MRVFTHIVMLFYITIILLVGGSVIAFVSHAMTLSEVNYYLGIAYNDINLRALIIAITGSLVFLSLLFSMIITGRHQK